MKFRKVYLIITLIFLLNSCQTTILNDSDGSTTLPEYIHSGKITVRAHLPEVSETRAQITYGNNDEDNEFFMWNYKDWIALFNVTRLEECPPEGVQLETTELYNNNRSAVFESFDSLASKFNIEKGDTILAMFGETLYRQKDAFNIDERKIFRIGVGTEANKPQIIVLNPDTASTEFMNSSLAYLSDNIKMYDIVIANENGKIPDLHFKHLSSIFRVTLHNATGKDLFPTKLEFEYPSISGNKEINGEESIGSNDEVEPLGTFYNTNIYFSIVGNKEGGCKFKIYDSKEFYNGTNPYTSSIGSTINAKDNTEDIGATIRNGETYDLYLSTIPRIGNDSKGDELNISLILNHETAIDKVYKCTIEGFDKVIEPGLRYWFKLTATPDSKLVRSSQWNPETQTIK